MELLTNTTSYSMPLEQFGSAPTAEGKFLYPIRSNQRHKALTTSTPDIAVMAPSLPAQMKRKNSFPTCEPLCYILPSDFPLLLNEAFTFHNREKVIQYIQERPALRILYKSLHVLIRSVFGGVPVHLRIFEDTEEGWSNLMVEVKSNCSIDEALELEEKLLSKIEENDAFFPALMHVTISVDSHDKA